MRVDWDGLSDERDRLVDDLAAYAAAGVQHVVTSVRQTDLDGWLRSVEALREIFATAP